MHWLKGVYTYEGTIDVPLEEYILAFSKKNAKDMVIYSPLWNNDVVEQIMEKNFKIKEFTIKNKSIDIREVSERNLIDLKLHMSNEDFSELLLQWIGNA